MDSKKFDAKKSALVFLLAFLVAQIVMSIWQIVLLSILKACNYHNANNFLSNPYLYCVYSLGQFAVFVSIFIICYKKFGLKDEIKQEKLDIKWLLTFLALGVVTMFALSNFVNYFTTALNLLGQPSNVLQYSIDSWPSYLCSIVSLAVLPAVGEELLFRGTIFNGLKQKGKLYAVVMSSVMFAIFHFSLSQLYYPLLFGMLLGLAYAYTDNIYVPIGMHFLNNALNLTLQFVSSSGTISTPKLWTVIVGVVIYLLILFFCLLKVNEKEPDTAPQTQKKKDKFFKSDNFKIAWPIAIMVVLYILLVFLT